MNDGTVYHNSPDMDSGQCINNPNSSISPELVPQEQTVTISSEEYSELVKCRRYTDKHCKVFTITSGDEVLIQGFVPHDTGDTELATISKYLQNYYKEVFMK